MDVTLRQAIPGDEHVLIDLIKGLAEFENEPEAVVNTAENLARDLFELNRCEAILAEQNGVVVGFALYYISYSTWKGACLYLEDLYVIPEVRGTGAGGKLFDRVVEIARERNFARMDWQVLDWNSAAIEFYKKRGATIDSEWLNGRLFF